MQLGAATNLCGSAAAIAFGLALLAACSSAPYEPGKLSTEQVAKCRALEAAYRTNSADYPALRDDLAQDGTAAAWLVRMFVSDLFAVREERPLTEDTEFLRAAARITNPVEVRALAEIKALGAVAVPTLVGDLLQHEQPQPRELGIELLGLVGAPAVPRLLDIVQNGETKHRRAAARALGRIGVDGQILATLRELVNDSDYTVRADALRSLRGGGLPAQQLLIERLRGDGDPFVRRVAAETLGHFKATSTVVAVVDYLERCKLERDYPGEQAAQKSLQRLSGTRSPRTPQAWRVWGVEAGELEPGNPSTQGR